MSKGPCFLPSHLLSDGPADGTYPFRAAPPPPQTANHCSERSATVMSFAQSGDVYGVPALGAIPRDTGVPGRVDLGLTQVAIMTESISSYSSVLRQTEKSMDTRWAP